jgi:nucleotide-binding universal stress UspA family protein
MFKHLLVPTDGSATAQKAVDAAIQFARQSGARITLFTAMPEYQLPGQSALLAHQKVPSMADHEREGRAQAAALLAGSEAQARAAGVDCGTDSAFSDRPWQAIIDAARRNACDVIFIGSHGRKGLAALWYGSETEEVLTHSDIPTLVYR